jgi:uncharacterized protein
MLAGGQEETPAPPSRITDLTGTLSGGAVSRLEGDIAGLEATRGSRIAVLIVASTQPADVEQYAAQVMRALTSRGALGGDGALLLIAKDDRRVRIEVGAGLRKALSAATIDKILYEVIAPHFELGDFDGGVEAGVRQMIAVINGGNLPDPDLGWVPHRGLRRFGFLLLGALLGAAAVLLAGILSRRARSSMQF